MRMNQSLFVRTSIAATVLALAFTPLVTKAQPPSTEDAGKPVFEPGMKVELPCVIYQDGENEGAPVFIPSGWMGNHESLEYDDCWQEKPHAGTSCIRCVFSKPGSWGGIAWQNPDNNWGNDPGGVDLTGASKLVFWAKGDQGGETVEFKMGIIPKNKPYWDSSGTGLGRVKLSSDWKKYEILLQGKDLRRIITGFVFSVKSDSDPVTFYLDDIVYE